MPKPVITTKKSPASAVQSIILLQIILGTVVFISSFYLDYTDLVNKLNFARNLSNDFFLGLLYFLVEVVSVILIFINWSLENVQIKPDQLIERRGFIYIRSRIIRLNSVRYINYEQGFIGKIFHYGDLVIDTAEGRFLITNISDPNEFISNIAGISEFSFDTNANLDNSEDEVSEEDIINIIKAGEGEKLEFKSSFSWDLRQGKLNKELEKVVMKSLSGFMNTDGGMLVIGIGDNSKIIGLDSDYNCLRKKNSDGFESRFTQVFNSMIGAEFRKLVYLRFIIIDGKEVSFITVSKSNKPVYLKEGDDERFYIRTGNSTTPLKLSEVANYVSDRWG